MPIPNTAEDGTLELLDRRRSTPARQLGAPAPDHPTLLRILRSAVRVPDHGKRVPFRFLRIEGGARHVLGEAVATIGLRLRPGAAPAAVDKDRQRFAHAPLVLAVIAVLDPEDTIPETERLMTAGCVCFAVLQAAQALGFGAQWLTAWMADDVEVARHLGLADNERIVGFIHIGTPKLQVPERERPDAAALLQDWRP